MDHRVDSAPTSQKRRQFVRCDQISKATLSDIAPFEVVRAEFIDNDDVLTALIEFRRDV